MWGNKKKQKGHLNFSTCRSKVEKKNKQNKIEKSETLPGPLVHKDPQLILKLPHIHKTQAWEAPSAHYPPSTVQTCVSDE